MFDENGEKRDKFATKPADSNVNLSSLMHTTARVARGGGGGGGGGGGRGAWILSGNEPDIWFSLLTSWEARAIKSSH